MKGGLRHLPVPRRGQRRFGVLGLGLLAAISMVWQQSATVANYTDEEFSKATFTAAGTLPAIAPSRFTSSSVATQVEWPAAEGDWAPSEYTLSWSKSSMGTNPTAMAPTTKSLARHTVGESGDQAYSLNFTAVSAGYRHACGIAQGVLYCWGTSVGGLGTGSTLATTPTVVDAFSKKKVTALAAGKNFSCAVADKLAYCWGTDDKGQLGNGVGGDSADPVAVSGLSGKNVTSISAGGTHACAVASGALYCWGSDAYGQLGDNTTIGDRNVATPVYATGVLNHLKIASVSAGMSHTCAVADNQAFCWGRDTNGQLGDITTYNARIPVAVLASGVLAGRKVHSVTAGTAHTCALADGQAFCWGLNANGQLGDGSTSQRITPVTVTGITKVTSISAGAATSCAVAGGRALCWGSRANYGVGDSLNTPDGIVPVAIDGTLNSGKATQVSAGADFGCAVAGSSPVACWGLGASSQLGDDDTASNHVPADVTLKGTRCDEGSVRTGGDTCSLAQGTPYYYKLGYKIGTWTAYDSAWVRSTTELRGKVNPLPDSSTSSSIILKWPAATDPGDAYQEYTVERSTTADHTDASTIAVTDILTVVDQGGVAPTAGNFTQISAGGAHTCGITEAQLYCWGLNDDGQLGLGDKNRRTEPTLVTTFVGKVVTAVSAGGYHTCAIAGDQVYCWGQNDYGQVGDNTSGQDRTSPVEIGYQMDYTATSISAGLHHTCGIGKFGETSAIYCWGQGSSGQLGTGNVTTQRFPTQVLTTTGLAGKVLSQVSAGSTHTCAVAGGAAYCWGDGTNGKLGTGSSTTTNRPAAVLNSGVLSGKKVSKISAGEQHTCAIASTLVYCWGSDASGQLGNDSAAISSSSPVAVLGLLSGKTVTAISVGQLQSCAVASGASYCWGANGNGQLGNGTVAQSGVPVAPVGNDALDLAPATDVAAGNAHSCTIVDGAVFCWGLGSNGRLGTGAATSDNFLIPQTALIELRCATDAPTLGDGTCSLAPSTTYWYLVTFTLDGNISTQGDWIPLKTAAA